VLFHDKTSFVALLYTPQPIMHLLIGCELSADLRARSISAPIARQLMDTSSRNACCWRSSCAAGHDFPANGTFIACSGSRGCAPASTYRKTGFTFSIALSVAFFAL